MTRSVTSRRLVTVVAALLLGLLPALTACQTIPATGKSRLNFMGERQEISLGMQAAPEFLASYGGPIPSRQVTDYVSDLGARLAAVSERPNLPWEFHAVDSAQINAFALPGGKVFITRGLLERMSNEAQLAGVLGHEIGHVTAMHIGQQMSRAILIQVGAAAIGAAAEQSDRDWLRVLGAGAQVSGGLYILSFGRDQETEADELGLRYMTRLGYNPIAQVQVMEILQEAMGSGGRQPEFLSTHPYPETRVKRLTQLIQQRYPNFQSTNDYTLEPRRYQARVLDQLRRLPPPKQSP